MGGALPNLSSAHRMATTIITITVLARFSLHIAASKHMASVVGRERESRAERERESIERNHAREGKKERGEVSEMWKCGARALLHASLYAASGGWPTMAGPHLAKDDTGSVG